MKNPVNKGNFIDIQRFPHYDFHCYSTEQEMLKMRKMHSVCTLLLIVSMALTACSGTKEAAKGPEVPKNPPLRVGVAPDFPPLVFLLDSTIVGVEPDLAHLLAQALKRPLSFRAMKFEQLIPALMEGKIDIVMSGMTITRARSVRVDFAQPYFRGGLFAAMRSDEQALYDTREKILQADGNVGVVPGTSAEVFVNRNIPNARRLAIAKVDYAAQELKNRRIDYFIGDGPAVVWLVSKNESGLAGYWKPLAREELGWAVRRGDGELLNSVNDVLTGLKKDGTLKKILLHWLPYLSRIK
jgi:ABC-type amino acid transport substrate-binding protein